ncbi:hypothetical protein KFE25_010275 [Diacronema lutheri]|uniref:SSD domain-containing protein n=3 Tax=Diacronema lutheri TaxID=2081491 RepID=A0A8J5XGD9_DIALT|nr:hypothetical protein KFE25_010275 [Diacronema lutheri]
MQTEMDDRASRTPTMLGSWEERSGSSSSGPSDGGYDEERDLRVPSGGGRPGAGKRPAKQSSPALGPSGERSVAAGDARAAGDGDHIPIPYAVRRARAAYVELARWIVAAPRAVIAAAVCFVLLLAMGLRSVEVLVASERLYIPQHSTFAAQRHELEHLFGTRPDPGMLLVTRGDGGDVFAPESVLELFELWDAIEALVVEVDNGREKPPTYASIGELCAHRYVARAGGDVCLRLSLLGAWDYDPDTYFADADPAATLTQKYMSGELIAGGLGWDAAGTTLLTARATQVHLLFDPTREAYRDERLAVWESALVALLDGWHGTLVARAVDDAPEVRRQLRITYWSSPLHERSASDAARQDAPIIAIMFVAIVAYVSLALSGCTCESRSSRALLGVACGVTTGMALVAGVGLAVTLGVPAIAVDSLLCFTLIGVSVDDMIIIVDAFDRARTRSASTAEQLGMALGDAGPAILLTSLTTMAAFFTGALMDMPAISLFCIPAGLAFLCVNLLQSTFFAAILFLHARARERATGGAILEGKFGEPPASAAAASRPRRLTLPTITPRRAAQPPQPQLHFQPPSPPLASVFEDRNAAERRAAAAAADSAQRRGKGRMVRVSSMPGALADGGAGAPAGSAASVRARDELDALDALRARAATGSAAPAAGGERARGARADGAGGADADAGEGGSCAQSRAGVAWRTWGIDAVLHPLTRACVLLVFGGLCVLAALALPNMQTGMSVSAVVAPRSMAGRFWADTRDIFADEQIMHVVLVVRGLEAEASQPALRAALREARALPFIVGVLPSWLDAYDKWALCVARTSRGAESGEGASAALPASADDEGARAGVDLQQLADFLTDGDVHSCATDAERAAREARKAAQRLLEPCFDDDDEFYLISSGRVCADAVSQCPPTEQYAATVRKLCPRLCGVCEPKLTMPDGGAAATALALALDAGADSAAPPARDAAASRNGSAPAVADAAATPDDGEAAVVADAAVVAADAPRVRPLPESASGGREFASDVIRDDYRGHDSAASRGPAAVVAHRVVLVSRMKENMRVDWEEQFPALQAVLERHGVDGFVYHYRYEFGACDATMPRLLLTNLAVAAACICAVCALFLQLRTAVLCALAVLCIDGILIGAMAAYGVSLHAVTGITLLVSLGLAIDYSSHLCHAYEHAPMEGARDKVAHALATMGLSVLNGGSSTLLGVAFMAFSVTPIFKTLFLILSHTIVIGLLVAVFVIPAAIVTADSLQRWVGERWHCAKRPRREASTASVDSQRSGVGVRLVLH